MAWSTVGAAGADQRTPNIAGIIQEIVNRAGWSSGNSLVIVVTGTRLRIAEAYNGVPSAAPEGSPAVGRVPWRRRLAA